MIRRPPRSTQSRSSAASDVYKRQGKARQRPHPLRRGMREQAIDAHVTEPGGVEEGEEPLERPHQVADARWPLGRHLDHEPSYVVRSDGAESTPADPVSYTHLRAHETRHDIVCRLLLEKTKRDCICLYLIHISEHTRLGMISYNIFC